MESQKNAIQTRGDPIWVAANAINAPIDMPCEGDDAVSGSLGWRAIFFGKTVGKMVVKLASVAR